MCQPTIRASEKASQNEPSGQTEGEEPEETNGDINETLLVDEAGIKITAQSLALDLTSGDPNSSCSTRTIRGKIWAFQ